MENHACVWQPNHSVICILRPSFLQTRAYKTIPSNSTLIFHSSSECATPFSLRKTWIAVTTQFYSYYSISTIRTSISIDVLSICIHSKNENVPLLYSISILLNDMHRLCIMNQRLPNRKKRYFLRRRTTQWNPILFQTQSIMYHIDTDLSPPLPKILQRPFMIWYTATNTVQIG